MKKIARKVLAFLSRRAEPAKAFADFLAFLASLILVIYSAGYLYLREFFNQFNLALPSFWDATTSSLTFLDRVILRDIPISLMKYVFGALLFACVYFAATNVMRSFYGYLLLTFTVAIMIVFTVKAGKDLGESDGKNAWCDPKYPTATVLVREEATINPNVRERLKNGDLYRLLHQDEIYSYFYTPSISGCVSDSQHKASDCSKDTQGEEPVAQGEQKVLSCSERHVVVLNRNDIIQMSLSR